MPISAALVSGSGASSEITSASVGPSTYSITMKYVTLMLARVVDRHDVRVVEAGRRPRLALEAGDEIVVVGQLGQQELHRDRSTEDLIDGLVDLGHLGPADPALEPVPPREVSQRRRDRATRWRWSARGAEEDFAGLGPLHEQVQVVLPRVADAAVDLDRPLGR